MSKSRSSLQRFFYSLGAVIAGVLLLGELLDSIANALAVVSWPITVGGTAALLIGGPLVQFILGTRGVAWTVAGKQHTVRGLGPSVIGGLVGMLILLWVPSLWWLATQSSVQPIAQQTANDDNGGATAPRDAPDNPNRRGPSPSDRIAPAPNSSPTTTGPTAPVPSRSGSPSIVAPSDSDPSSNVAPVVDCTPALIDRQPDLTMRTGDIAVLASELSRVDKNGESKRILSSDFLRGVRGAAVEPTGTILASTGACGKGALVRFDPRTGTQTPLVVGAFRTPIGIFVEAGGETVLVGDEAPGGYGDGSWGALLRINLVTRQRQVLHVFPATGSETATGIALHPKTGELYFVAGALYRMELKTNQPRRIDVEGLPRPRNLTITPDGEVYVADSELNAVLRIDLERRSASTLIDKQSFTGGWIGMASALDGKSIYIGSATASGEGVMTNVSLPPDPITVKEVWKGRRELGVFVAVASPVKR
jgi:hypothetical protein